MSDATHRKTSLEKKFNLALQAGQVEKVKGMIDKGYDIQVLDGAGWRPSERAAVCGLLEVVKLLLEKGSGVNSEDQSLIFAASFGREHICKLLIEVGADVEAYNANGETPLLKASQTGHASILQMVSDAGANINREQPPQVFPLHAAAHEGFPDAVQVLLQEGVDIKKLDAFGKTALEVFQKEKHRFPKAVVDSIVSQLTNSNEEASFFNGVQSNT